MKRHKRTRTATPALQEARPLLIAIGVGLSLALTLTLAAAWAPGSAEVTEHPSVKTAPAKTPPVDRKAD
jgi:hypothetical protein